MFQEGLQNMYMPGCLFFHLKKKGATNLNCHSVTRDQEQPHLVEVAGDTTQHHKTQHNFKQDSGLCVVVFCLRC